MLDMSHILIVDDDREIRDLLSQFLQKHGYQVTAVADGTEMRHQLAHQEQGAYDLVVLDLMLPGEDGLSLCRQLRSTSTIPIVMLTAVGEDVDRIIGLEMGADDYITKPFNPRELVARIKAVLRRNAYAQAAVQGSPALSDHLDLDSPASASPDPNQPHPDQPQTLTPLQAISNAATQVVSSPTQYFLFEGWLLDLGKRELRACQASSSSLASSLAQTSDLVPSGTLVSLTAGEFDLLLAFVEHPQRVLSRDQLLEYTKGYAAVSFDRSIDVQLSRLRRKIEANPKEPQLIKTVRGGGYLFTPVVTTTTATASPIAPLDTTARDRTSS
ncbi:MAG: response regulator [Cyanothece sp. SIO2G6]|nr:response regulator [Cyanothece sp. SIO2G6]